MKGIIKKNAHTLTNELNWLSMIIDTSIKLYFGEQTEFKSVYEIEPPDITLDESFYAEVIKRDQINFAERIVLLLSITPHIKPEILDIFLLKNAKQIKTLLNLVG